jgi:hypothetical protein
LLQVADDRDALTQGRSQNLLEAVALREVVWAVPSGGRPVVLADRGFARATFLAWQQQGIDLVVRLHRRPCLTAAAGRRVKLGVDDHVARGQVTWWPRMRCGL